MKLTLSLTVVVTNRVSDRLPRDLVLPIRGIKIVEKNLRKKEFQEIFSTVNSCMLRGDERGIRSVFMLNSSGRHTHIKRPPTLEQMGVKTAHKLRFQMSFSSAHRDWL